MNDIIKSLEDENKRILPDYYLGYKPIYTRENRELFDLLALNCLAANISTIHYYPKEDVTGLIKKMFKEGALRYPCAGINIDRFCDDMLIGKLDEHGVYQYLMAPFRVAPHQIDGRAVSYTILLMSLLPTPIVPPALYKSNMLSMYGLHYTINKAQGAQEDLDTNKLTICWHLRDLITRCTKKNILRNEEWFWWMLDAVKQYALLYISTLLNRYSEYPQLKPISDRVFTTTLSAHREIVTTRSLNPLMKGI